MTTLDDILSGWFPVNVDTVAFSVSNVSVDLHVSEVILASPHGEFLYKRTNRKAIPGKDGRHPLQVRFKTPPSSEFGELTVEGSPFANRYGQNVWSTASVQNACIPTLRQLVTELKIQASQETIDSWEAGNVSLQRVDLAVNLRLQSEEQVDDVLTQLKRQMVSDHCQYSGHARYVALCPKNSSHYRVAAYAKGSQMRLKTAGDRSCANFQRLVDDCSTLLRIEVRLLYPELKSLNMQFVRNWSPPKARALFRKYCARLPLHKVTFGPLSAADFDGINERMRPVLALHKLGAQWLSTYTPRTRARHKAYFRKRGIDLDCPNQPEAPICLIDVLSKHHAAATTPQWLIEAGMAPARKRNAKSENTRRPTTYRAEDFLV